MEAIHPVMQGIMTAGGVIGPLLGGVLAELFGMRISFFLAAAGLFINCLVFIFVIKEPPAPAPAPAGKKTAGAVSLWKTPLIWKMLLCATIVQMVILILQPILTTYITELAGQLPNIIFVSGLVFSLGGIAGAMAAPVWGQLGQRHGFFKTMSLALLCAGAAIIIQGLPRNLYLFAGMQFIGGLFFCGIHPSINAILAENTRPEVKGRIFGLLFSAQQVGGIIGPILGGAIATFAGMQYVFYTAGILLIFLSLNVYRQFIRKQPAAG